MGMYLMFVMFVTCRTCLETGQRKVMRDENVNIRMFNYYET